MHICYNGFLTYNSKSLWFPTCFIHHDKFPRVKHTRGIKYFTNLAKILFKGINNLIVDYTN